MLAPRAPQPELIQSYLAHGLARLYVTARTAEGRFDQYVGLDDTSLTEVLARALFAANRQGRTDRQIAPPLLPPLRQHVVPMPDFRTLCTETILGVEVTTTREPMAVLQALAEQAPRPVDCWALSQATGQFRGLIPNRITFLRRLLRRNYPALDIPPVSRRNAGWRLTLAEAAS